MINKTETSKNNLLLFAFSDYVSVLHDRFNDQIGIIISIAENIRVQDLTCVGHDFHFFFVKKSILFT